MPKEIKLVPLELAEIDRYEASQIKFVQIFNTLLDNTEYENAEILYMGEFVCVYTSDSCKERSAQVSDLLFRESEERAAKTLLRSQLPFNVSHMSVDNLISTIIKLGYRQIVQEE